MTRHAGDQLVQAREMLGRRRGVGAQDPIRALEQVGARALDAVHLGARHGMAGHVVVRMREDLGGDLRQVRLGGSGVGDDALEAPFGEQTEDRLGGVHRRRHDGEIRLQDEIAERGCVRRGRAVDPPLRDRDLAGALVDVGAEQPDSGIGVAQRRGERRADKPQARDGDAGEGRLFSGLFGAD